MATQYKTESNEWDLEHRIDALRSSLTTMLQEVAIGLQPVSIDPDNGIDFYKDVERYEIQLIESALILSGGRQNRAAKLLHLPTSTLCTKMKQFKIRRNGSFSKAAY